MYKSDRILICYQIISVNSDINFLFCSESIFTILCSFASYCCFQSCPPTSLSLQPALVLKQVPNLVPLEICLLVLATMVTFQKFFCLLKMLTRNLKSLLPLLLLIKLQTQSKTLLLFQTPKSMCLV